MVEFETIDSTEIQPANDGFIVVASKRAISETGEREFISISKGFTKDGERKFKQTVTIPRDAEVVEEVVRALKSVA